jgi:tagatose 6-phosphate kinase
MILVVGLSPAWQRTLEFDKFVPREVNRARRVTESASGKGVNVARVARSLGAHVRLLAVAGGYRGELLARELPWSRIVRVEAETRICQTLLADGATELVEEAAPLRAEEVERVVKVFTAELRRASLVVLTGTVPSGCGDGFYARLVRLARERGLHTLVDAQGKLLENAMSARPFLVRVNRRELAAVTQREGAAWLVVSHGAGGVQVVGADERWRATPPRVEMVNPIGSGDAMLAGIAVALARGESMREAVRLGIACGSANVLIQTPGVVRRIDVKRLLRQVRQW